MAGKTRTIYTNFNGGEFSPLIEGRVDLQKYYSGAQEMLNVTLFRQGGFTRRTGTRIIAETRDSSKKSRLIPFEFNIEQAYQIEVGEGYFRFYKDTGRIESPPTSPVQIGTPYLEADLALITFTQSADVLYLDHRSYDPRKLSRLSHISWTLTLLNPNPPPTVEEEPQPAADLTPGATTGTGVTFTASASVFFASDVGRLIISGASRATIASVVSGTQVTADILDPFPDTEPIPSGSWFLRLSPQTTLDPDAKGPKGRIMTCVTGAATWRTADVGKFIRILGGLLKIKSRTNDITISCEIVNELKDSTAADPAIQPAGSWTLEIPAWSPSRGFPGKVTFMRENRLLHASSKTQLQTLWASVVGDYENHAPGSAADDAFIFTLTNNNTIAWVVSQDALYIGTNKDEFRLKGAGVDEPVNAADAPDMKGLTAEGSAEIDIIRIGNAFLYVQRTTRKLIKLKFNVELEEYQSTDITILADHILGPGIKEWAFQKEPNSTIWMVRKDGVLVSLTYYEQEDVLGFCRHTTDGLFESVSVIPHPDKSRDQVWFIVNRTINGETKRYVEVLEENASELTREWKQFMTDCAATYVGAPATIISNLNHLEGKTVKVVADGALHPDRTILDGKITLERAASEVEVGLGYTSRVVTMRPEFPGSTTVQGLPKSWSRVFIRVKDTNQAKINGETVLFHEPDQPMGKAPPLFSGDKRISLSGIDNEGRITIEQTEPLPLTVLALFGEIHVGDY